MTRLIWVRHAIADVSKGIIAGRGLEIGLSPTGILQARRLGDRLLEENLQAIFSSPQRRARETAEEIARTVGREISVADGLDELDYGEWTGRSFAQLDALPEWRAFNSTRSCTRIPGGEMILEVQARTIRLCERLAGRYPRDAIALVTHADVIRAALAYYLALPIDLSLRLEVSPASRSIVTLDGHCPQVVCINCTGERM